MKKLLAPLTLLFLVACQPSELEGCVVANTEPTPTNNYIIKYNLYTEQTLGLLIDGVSDEAFNKYMILANDFYNSLNPLELIVNQCIQVMELELYAETGLTLTLSDSEITKLGKQNVESCMLSTANEVKELQLKIEAENTEKAQSVCNAQGIY